MEKGAQGENGLFQKISRHLILPKSQRKSYQFSWQGNIRFNYSKSKNGLVKMSFPFTLCLPKRKDFERISFGVVYQLPASGFVTTMKREQIRKLQAVPWPRKERRWEGRLTRLLQSSLGGRRRERIIRHEWLSRGRQRRAREAAQVTAASRPAAGHRRLGGRQAGARKYEWPHGKTHDTHPTGAPRGSRTADRPGKRLLPRGTKPPSHPIPPLCARGDDPAPRPTRFLSRGQADSRCHHSPRPDAAPRTTRSILTIPPALQSQGCPRSPLTVPAQAAAG